MLITESMSNYKYLSLGNIKLAFTQICKPELFKDVYFATNTLYYVESGTAILQSGDEVVEVTTGNAILIRQHSKLNIKKFQDNNGEDFQSVLLYLFPDFLSKYLSGKPLAVEKEVSNRNFISLSSPKLSKFCFSLLDVITHEQSSAALIEEMIVKAFHLLVQEDQNIADFLAINATPLKIDLYEFMLHNILSDYSIAEFARLTGRSISSFKRDFRAIFSTSPHRWLLRQKIDYAEELLKTTSMKPSDIYLILGFNELSHFSAAFKKIKGCSPSKINVVFGPFL